MKTLYDLTKQIDALTYNSRQVLNALVRSCIASGSSSGYTVNKYGQAIVLSRADIYRLYTFYENWEAEGFPGDEKFDALLSRLDEGFASVEAGDSPVTDAVVSHAKILYMSASNKDLTDSSYWTGLVKDSASPKSVVSTAPIPINLRTPIYDENLSVKSFSQYETYLFPIGYQRTEILGTPGNDNDYVAGGRSWTIDASDTLMLSGNHITMGGVTNPQNRLDNYGKSRLTLSWGKESYAVANTALALGDHSIAAGDTSIAAGLYSIAYGAQSLAAGGASVRTIGTRSAAFNSGAEAGGRASIAANINTVTGGMPYNFYTGVTWEDQETAIHCNYVYDTVKQECVPAGDDPVDNVNNAGTKTLFIDTREVDAAGMPIDLEVGDDVVIYDLSYLKSAGNPVEPYADDGFTEETIVATVVAVDKPAEGTDYYTVTLNKEVKASNSKYAPIVSGRIMCVQRRGVPAYDEHGNPTYDLKKLTDLGYGSNAFNQETIAHGIAQTVVGRWNTPDYHSSFIVGVGSSNERRNALLVGENYSYMKVADGRSSLGVSTAFIESPQSDFRVVLEGAFLRSASQDEQTEGRIQAVSGSTELRSNGDRVIKSHIGTAVGGSKFLSDSGLVTSLVESREGAAVIASGNSSLNLVDTMVAESLIVRPQSNSVALYAENGIELRDLAEGGVGGIDLNTNAYISMEFAGMRLTGNTFGALPTTDKSRTHILRPSSAEWAETVGHSGFYYGTIATDGFQVNGLSGNVGTNVHVFNSTAELSGGTYSTLSVAFPPPVSNGTHPVVTSATYTEGGTPTFQSKELAYLSDIATMGTVYASSGMRPIYYADTHQLTGMYSVDATGTYIPAIVIYRTGSSAPSAVWSNCEVRYTPTGDISIYDPVFQFEILSISNVRYAIIGKQITVSFKVTPREGTNGGVPFTPVRFRVPLFLNMKPVLAGDEAGTLPYIFLGGIKKYAGITVVDNAVESWCRGYLFSDGSLILNGKFEDEYDITKPKTYTITGIAPFTVDPATVASGQGVDSQSVIAYYNSTPSWNISTWNDVLENLYDYIP